MKRLLTVLLMSFTLWPLAAQLTQPTRWEQDNKFFDEAYSIVSLKEEGLALVRDKEKYHDGKRIWELVILDTDLQQKWTMDIELHDELRFVGYEYIPGKVNLMFRRNLTDILKAEMLMIDLATQSMQHSTTEIRLQIRLTHYTVVDGNCVFGGYVGTEPVLIIHDPQKNNNFIVPGFFLTDTELLDVRPNKNNTFSILLFQRTQGRKKLMFRTFDKTGTILIEDEIPVDDDKTILSGVSSRLEHDEVMIAGAYTFKNEKLASGIFSCLIDPFSEQVVKYEEFHQFRHFLDYLPDKRAGKIREKATQRTSYGKSPGFKTSVGIHRIEEFKGGFALFGESFIATSGASNNTFSNPYSSSAYGTPYSYTPFSNRFYNNPYQFPANSSLGNEDMRMLEGFVIGYDFKGRRLWDYSIPMDEVKVPGRDQVSDFIMVQDIPHFLFKYENELKYSSHDTDTTQVAEARTIPILLKNEYEQAKTSNELEGNVRHWYGSYFYVWGTQTVKDTRRKDVDPTRRVFYVNKIKVE